MEKDLATERSAEIDPPPWLWRAIVDLVGAHGTAYLDHCRRYALAPPDAA